MKKSKSFKYYVIGFSFIGITLILLLTLIIVVSLNPIEDISNSYYLFILLGFAIVLFIVGYILLKKGNKEKLNEKIDDNQEIIDKINEIYQEKGKKD